MAKLPTTKLQLLEKNLTEWLGKQYFLDEYDSNFWEGDYPEATHYVDCPDTAYDDAAHAIEESGWKILGEMNFIGSDYDGVTFFIKEDKK